MGRLRGMGRAGWSWIRTASSFLWGVYLLCLLQGRWLLFASALSSLCDISLCRYDAQLFICSLVSFSFIASF